MSGHDTTVTQLRNQINHAVTLNSLVAVAVQVNQTLDLGPEQRQELNRTITAREECIKRWKVVGLICTPFYVLVNAFALCQPLFQPYEYNILLLGILMLGYGLTCVCPQIEREEDGLTIKWICVFTSGVWWKMPGLIIFVGWIFNPLLN